MCSGSILQQKTATDVDERTEYVKSKIEKVQRDVRSE